MANQQNKEKRVVFTDTDVRHAQLRIRLQHDGITQADFFRAIITGYLENDSKIVNFLFDHFYHILYTRGYDTKILHE